MGNRVSRPEPDGVIRMKSVQGDRRQMKAARKTGTKLWHAIVGILLTLVVLVSLGAVSFLFLQISGKNSLYSRADSRELVTTLSDMAVSLGEDTRVAVEELGDWQEGDIRYKGIHYRYNSDILTILFLGIDKMEKVQPVENGEYGGQSDALFLLVLDPHEKKISVIGIPRDTMAELEVYEEDGRYIGTATGQVALQHAYGDGTGLSCERSVKAVSKLFYGLPIHGYCSINMGAVPDRKSVV